MGLFVHHGELDPPLLAGGPDGKPGQRPASIKYSIVMVIDRAQ